MWLSELCAPPCDLLVLLRAVGEQDALGLHVSVQHPLQRRHVTLDDVLDLRGTQSRHAEGGGG